MRHDLHDRDDGLAHCKVCGGAEGSMPTDCPGRRMTADEQDEVYAERLDFKRGKWWLPNPFTGAWFFEHLTHEKQLRAVEPDGTEHVVDLCGSLNTLAGIRLLNAMVRGLTKGKP